MIDGLPLIGFGNVLAVSVLLNDFDCVGNSGANLGYHKT